MITKDTAQGRALRALVAIRLSVKTDETTSPQRQREAGEGAAARIGAEVVGYAEDLDVSASRTTPFERPELGDWLARPDDYDVVVWWRLDRAVRSMADMADLARWAKRHGKRLIFAEGPGGASLELDMTSIMSELIVMLLAFAAQMESQSIKERVTGANAALRSVGRYSGGLPPYGYKPVPLPDGEGWTLAPDPEQVGVIEAMIRMLVDGDTPHSIAAHVNAAGVMTPRDWNDVRQGRESKGRKWVSQTVKRLLLSRSLIGHQLHNGVTVRDRKGNPVMITDDPILTPEERARIKELLEAREAGPRGDRKDTGALLLGVLHCAGCGGRMYRVPASGYPIYACRASARGLVCPSPAAIKTEWVEEWTVKKMLDRFGEMPVVETITHAGYDPRPELADLEEELRSLYAAKDTRRSGTGRKVWQEQVDALERRAEVLEATPVTPSRVKRRDTGQTYRDLWEARDEKGRRRMLKEAGIRVDCVKGTRGGRPEDMKPRALERLTFTPGHHERPDLVILEAIAHDEE